MTMKNLRVVLLTLSGVVFGSAFAAHEARGDVCFGGGAKLNEDRPDANDAGQDRGGDGQILGLGRSGRRGRYAGGGLILAAGLGGAWIGSRRKDREGSDPEC